MGELGQQVRQLILEYKSAHPPILLPLDAQRKLLYLCLRYSTTKAEDLDELYSKGRYAKILVGHVVDQYYSLQWVTIDSSMVLGEVYDNTTNPDYPAIEVVLEQVKPLQYIPQKPEELVKLVAPRENISIRTIVLLEDLLLELDIVEAIILTVWLKHFRVVATKKLLLLDTPRLALEYAYNGSPSYSIGLVPLDDISKLKGTNRINFACRLQYKDGKLRFIYGKKSIIAELPLVVAALILLYNHGWVAITDITYTSSAELSNQLRELV